MWGLGFGCGIGWDMKGRIFSRFQKISYKNRYKWWLLGDNKDLVWRIFFFRICVPLVALLIKIYIQIFVTKNYFNLRFLSMLGFKIFQYI